MGRKNSKKPGKKRQRDFDEYKGVLEITRSGMGFVVVPGLETDILVGLMILIRPAWRYRKSGSKS